MGILHGKIGEFLLVDVASASNTIQDIIPTATPHFATMTDLNMTTSTSLYVFGYRFKTAATKPELEITIEW